MSAAALTAGAPPAVAQIRIATYNTLGKPQTSDGSAQGQLAQIMFSLATDISPNGVSKRPDLVALQEQTPETVGQFASLLNTVFGVDTYEASVIGGGMVKTAFVYDSASVDLLGSQLIASGIRPTHRLHVRPVGYSSLDAEFYVYSAHLKAGTDFSDQQDRGAAAALIRSDADDLGSDRHVVFAGDFNIRFNTEPGYTQMVAPGDARAFDPIEVNQSWHNNSGISVVHTQSTRSSNLPDGGSSGGMDDRFDWQFVTDDLLDGEGLSYLGPTSLGLDSLIHSYWAFGNDGLSFNRAINNTTVNRILDGDVLDALHDFSDHLPVIADYQLPAVMTADLSPVPATIPQGSLVQLNVQVENAADVLVASAADELNYAVSLAGALTGEASGTADALEGPNVHLVTLDSTSLGTKNGTITITSSSEAAENALLSFPISYEVVAGLLLGDANNDSLVSGLDLIAVQQGFGEAEAGPPSGMLPGDANDDGLVTGLDLISVQENFGEALGPNPAAVPEPASLGAAMLIGLLIGPLRARGTLFAFCR